MTSNRPYLIRALYEWLVDNDLTPYLLVDAEQPQRLHEIEVSLARRHDAVAGPRVVEDLAVERVGGRKRERRRFLRLEPLLDLRSREVRPAVVQARGGGREIGRHGVLWIGWQLETHRRLDRFGDGLEPDPHTRVAR